MTIIELLAKGDTDEDQKEGNPGITPMGKYMVYVNWAGSVFVKEKQFFISQGGDTKPWGKAWIELEATSIENARERACALPGARPYSEQAKGP